MTRAYAYTPAIWPPLLGAMFLAAMGLFAWRRRNAPAVKPFLAISLFACLMLLGIALEAAAVTPATKIAWYKFQFLMMVLAVAGGTCFTLEYTYPGRWLTRRNLVLLSIPPLLVLLLIVVGDSRFMWRRLEVAPDGSVMPFFTIPGGILFAYAWGLVLVNAAAFVWLFIRSPQHRWPVAIMLFGQLVGRAAYLLNFVVPSPTRIDPTVLATFVPWTGYAITLFGFHIFDPLPAARQSAIEQMHAGVVVFDTGWRVLSLNPAAERILGARMGPARGKTWQQLALLGAPLPALPDASPQGTGAATEATGRWGDGETGRGDVSTRGAGAAREDLEMTFGSGASARHYAAALSLLADDRGLLAGHLLMLRDVTEERRSQARVVEQQRVLATLRERERLARELHDSAGQILAYVSMQAQAIAKRVQDGDWAIAEAQLRRLAEAAQEAHADIRESILSLKTGPAGEWSFLAVLKQYLAGFSDHSGIVAELAIQPGLGEEDFPAGAGVQLLRVIQEALTNARKHSGARRIRVTMSRQDGEVVAVVEDDGIGFDPNGFDPKQLTPSRPSGHYGLDFMAERMAEVGGRLAIESEPGAGTRVVLHAPIGG